MRTLKEQEHFIKCGDRIKPDQSPVISAASPISVAMPPRTVRFTIEALKVAYGKIQFSKNIDRRGLLLNKHSEPWTVQNYLLTQKWNQTQAPIHPYNPVAGEKHQHKYKEQEI
jgi:hypothetical protein